MKHLTKQAFQKHLQRHYWLRLHMFIILLATTLSGVLFSKMLLLLHVTDFRIRYPLSVVLSYLVFFICIKLWLCCITPKKADVTNTPGWVDLPLSPGRGPAGGVVPSLQGDGLRGDPSSFPD